jgi:1,4-dihydroxy-2-naphthoate octaprenyltransferase
VKKLWSFIKLSRLHFLVGGALMYAIGASTAESVSFSTYLLGQGMVTAAQLTAHYANEFADIKSDRLVRNRTLFSGGSGVLASGELTRPVALAAALFTTAATVVLIIFIEPISTPAALLGLLALLVAWAYSLRPIRLLDTGWGEAVTSLVVTVFVPLVGATTQGAGTSVGLIWIVASLFPVHLAMMLVFELPDLETDRRSHKRVLAARIGEALTRRTVIALLLSSGIVIGVAAALGAVELVTLWAVAAAVGPAVVTVRATRGTRYTLLTTSAVATFVVLGGALLATVIL